ncbi:hypothetical protein CEXT_789021 [Caerostris extrusa]|uniref:Uncharacterized protein n=1 Tax=Caerostris extrusa TaxID=172846 RepID=A0AAV4MQE2_CAEEX|nr:hypothetical protein CEXT_789021 [Caerostris extrusa]
MSIGFVLSPLHGVHEPAAYWASRDIRVSSSIRQCLPLLPFRRISPNLSISGSDCHCGKVKGQRERLNALSPVIAGVT